MHSSLWFVLGLCLVGSVVCREGDLLARSTFLTGDDGWTLAGNGWSSAGMQHEADRVVIEDDRFNPGKTWYIESPSDFLGGDKSLAYNGWLTFELGHFEYESMMEPLISDYDIILVCKKKNQNLGIKGIFIDDGATAHTYQVRLEESFRAVNSTASWQRVTSGLQAAQRDVVQCLQGLKAIKIRGSFFKGYEAMWLRDVKIIQGEVHKRGDDNWLGSLAPKDASQVTNQLVDGVTDWSLRQSAVSGDGSCCSSRTCVSNDKYEIVFDRPGCTTDWDPICVSGDATHRVTEIVKAKALTEGREHVMNQEYMGLRGKPLVKPFRHPFTFKSLPRICSTATLTVAAHGDLAYEGDNIVVYGEDGKYLGTLFAGNLTYEREDPYYAQTSETTPYIDSIVISQNAMTQYTADEQIKFFLSSERHTPRQGESGFKSGTHLSYAQTTAFCNAASCDLRGSVIVRWMKVTFSAAACYSAKSVGHTHTYDTKMHHPQPVNLNITFKTPTGDAAEPGGDGVLTVVTDSDIYEREDTIEVRLPPAADGTLGTKITELFTAEAFSRLPRGDESISQWAPPSGADTIPRFYADSALIPREALSKLVTSGTASLHLYSSRPGNTAKFMGTYSPIFFSYPLMSCFMHAIKRGPYMNVHIERPSNLYFQESGFALAGGDVTVFIAAHWQGHLRYPHSGGSVGNSVELPGDRADMHTSTPTQDQVDNHRLWPHGYSYMQLRSGLDGDLLADVFLKDYTQYDHRGYLTDTVVIPKDKFNSLVGSRPNGVTGEFSFSLWVPPGYGVVQLRSIVVGYPVQKASDASKYDDAEFETSFVNPRYPQPLA